MWPLSLALYFQASGHILLLFSLSNSPLPQAHAILYSHSYQGNIQNPWINRSVKLPLSFDTAEQFRWTEILSYQLNTELSCCWYNQLLVIPENGSHWDLCPASCSQAGDYNWRKLQGKSSSHPVPQASCPKAHFHFFNHQPAPQSFSLCNLPEAWPEAVQYLSKKAETAYKQTQEREEALRIVHVFSGEIYCYQL